MPAMTDPATPSHPRSEGVGTAIGLLEEAERAEREAELFAVDTYHLLRTELGARWLRHLERRTIERPSYRTEQTPAGLGPADDALFMAWRDGMNEVIRQLKDVFEQGYALIEAAEREQAEKQAGAGG